MTNVLKIALLFAALGAPSVARAETPLDAEVAAVIELARSAGLPVLSLDAKAREGLAKGVPAARVAAHLEALRVDLGRAVTLIGSAAEGVDREALVSGVAAALRARVSPGAIRQILTLPVGVRAPGARSLADLVAAGCNEADVLHLIDRAGRGPNPDAALHSAVTRAVTLITQGHPPDLAAAHAADHGDEAEGPPWGKDKDKDKGHGKDDAPGQQKK